MHLGSCVFTCVAVFLCVCMFIRADVRFLFWDSQLAIATTERMQSQTTVSVVSSVIRAMTLFLFFHSTGNYRRVRNCSLIIHDFQYS